MGGLGSGGPRPGSGRKRKATVDEQQSRRDVLLEVFSAPEFREVAESLLLKAKGGDLAACGMLLPYLLGSPKQETKHDVKVSGGVQIYLPERKKAE